MILLVVLVGCGSSETVTFDVRADGRLLRSEDRVRVFGTWTEVDGVSEITLRRDDPGVRGTADTDGSITLVVAIDSAALVPGAAIPVRGTTTYENLGHKANSPPDLVGWSDAASPVQSALLYAQCFCDASPGEATQDHDLMLYVDAVGSRVHGRIEGQVFGAPGLSGLAPFDITSDFSLGSE